MMRPARVEIAERFFHLAAFFAIGWLIALGLAA